MNHFCIDKQLNFENIGVHSFCIDQYKVYVDGLIYTYEKKAGKETIEWLLNEISLRNTIPFEKLCGAFSCVIICKDKTIVFTDNSNMHCIFFSENFVSNSFLKIIENEKKRGNHLKFNVDSICEYLTIGNIYFGKTFFSEIHILDSTQMIIIKNNHIAAISKDIGDIDEKSMVLSINDFFRKVAYSVSDYNICQALTGGYDSRMIYACLSKYIEDHVAISSNSEIISDVKCAKKTAEANGDELEIIKIEKPCFSKDLLDSILNNSDGIEPLDLDTAIRLVCFKNKLSDKYNLHLTGDGGVLHKDWEWTQDLPFYRKKKSNAKRFYHQRLFYIDVSNHIGDYIKESFEKQEERFINKLNQISKSMNTQSYDSWYYRVSGNRRLNYNNNPIPDIISYAPLMELDLVRYSYALPRYKRFFYNSIRETISEINIRIARVKTNYGTTASNEAVFLIRDVYFQLIEYFRKAYRLLGRKILKRNVLVDSFTDWTLEDEVKKSLVAIKSVEYAKVKGIIKEGIDYKEISYEEILRLIHIHWLARKITNEGNE